MMQLGGSRNHPRPNPCQIASMVDNLRKQSWDDRTDCENVAHDSSDSDDEKLSWVHAGKQLCSLLLSHDFVINCLQNQYAALPGWQNKLVLLVP